MRRMSISAHRVWQFIKLLTSRFVADQGLPSTASLTYTTLLSLVPLMTVSLAIFSAFPVSDRVAEEIQDFIREMDFTAYKNNPLTQRAVERDFDG